MQLYSINAGLFKLDGGAMFGVVPKKIWNKLVPADENNLCTWAMRCLLVIAEGKVVLIDCGMGDKQDEKFFGHYEPHGDYSIEASLKQLGLVPADVTDVFLTHLHFDHCGGGVKWNAAHTGYELTFANAKYWTHSEHWQTATFPNAREKATFFKENILPIQEAGQLYFSDQIKNPFGTLVQPIYADGHTEKMTMFKIEYKSQTVVFMADTIPSHAHIPVPYVMGYDVRPLETMKEKEALLKEALENNYLLFFDHDPLVDCCTVEMTDKGIRVKDKGLLGEFVK